ncbi:MAG TPA: hypothetical protein DDZ34_04780 [Syntrophaceae bacterium]|nr:hypothetical protein [Syntrophaceae bacterium]
MPRGRLKKQSGPGRTLDCPASFLYEAQLWQMADILRSTMGAAEYKHVVLTLIFLMYIAPSTSLWTTPWTTSNTTTRRSGVCLPKT